MWALQSRSVQVRLHNTLSGTLEDFEPIEAGVVRMYNCGPTVYDYAHIGNFRSFLFADLLRRLFEFLGTEVIQVMNITDVGHMTEDQLADGGGEDKIVKAMRELDLADPFAVSVHFTEAFLEDARGLGMKVAHEYPGRMPKATEHVDAMVDLIQRLMDAGHAYVADDGAVYYDVTSFESYGQLSGNTLDQLQAGAGGRVSEDQLAGKRHSSDFLLWKADPKHVMKWESPWGAGYPGWHIECSAMAMALHETETIDIHTGGEDNKFPHHECEIAQSTGATGKPFARYWLHALHLMVEGEKMAKSQDNFFTVRDLYRRGVEPSVLRYELIKTHYRRNLNFTFKGLEDSAKDIARLRQIVSAHPDVKAGSASMQSTELEVAFAEALADDLNISAALGALFTWVGKLDSPSPEDVAALRRVDLILGVLDSAEASVAADGLSDEKIVRLCGEIDAARAGGEYDLADKIRAELAGHGIDVQTTRDGSQWRRRVQS
jgi:cysteinyl-tRNA synthetase